MRASTAVESQAAQLAGAPSGTTFNGYFAAVVSAANFGFKLRRVVLGVRAGASVPTSQQMTVGIYRQTVRVVGTGFSTTVGEVFDVNNNAGSNISGIDVTTAATAGTTGPTINSNPLLKVSFNTQSAIDLPAEFLEEIVCPKGTANGIAFVNIGNALPASHLFTLAAEWEE